MNTQDILDPERWAKKTFGASQLKDMRRDISSRESCETHGRESLSHLARPNADLERDDGLVPTAQGRRCHF